MFHEEPSCCVVSPICLGVAPFWFGGGLFFLVNSPENVAWAEICLVVSHIRLDAAPFWSASEEIFLVAEALNLDAREICSVTSPFCLDATPFWFTREGSSCVVSPKKLASRAILLVASPLLVASTPMPSPRLRGEGAQRADEGRAEAGICAVTKHLHVRACRFPTLDPPCNANDRGSVHPLTRLRHPLPAGGERETADPHRHETPSLHLRGAA